MAYGLCLMTHVTAHYLLLVADRQKLTAQKVLALISLVWQHLFYQRKEVVRIE